MALFKPMKGDSTRLESQAFHEGYVWLATDTADLFFDAEDSSGVQKRHHVNARDNVPTENSDNAVKSGGVYSALSNKQNNIKLKTITLSAANWGNKQQSVAVEGVLADETKQMIDINPAAASKSEYESAGVMAISQGTGSLTFSCETVPENNLTVYVCITELYNTSSN